jgi:hypothetical protein
LVFNYEADHLGTSVLVEERVVQHTVRVSSKTCTGVVDHQRCGKWLGSSADGWIDVCHYVWLLLDRLLLSFIESKGNNSGSQGVAVLQSSSEGRGVRQLAIRSDNMVTVFNLQRQGASESLLYKTRRIFSILQKLDIMISVTHLPGKENVTAYTLSCMNLMWGYELGWWYSRWR